MKHREIKLFFVGLGAGGAFIALATAIAGTNNLPQVSARVIQLDHVNQPRTALSDTVVPRNSSGTVGDLNADLGSTTYRWQHVKTQDVHLIKDAGGNAVVLSAPSPLPSNIPVIMPSALPATSKVVSMSSTGQLATNVSGTVAAADLATDAVTTVKILNGNVTDAKRATLNRTCSPSSNETSTSTSWGTSANLSVTLTTVGRPVMLFTQPDEGVSSPGRIECSATTVTTSTPATCQWRITRNGTADGDRVVTWAFDLLWRGDGATGDWFQTDGATRVDMAMNQVITSGFHFVDSAASSGSNTWYLQRWLSSSASGGQTKIANTKFCAYEL